MAVAAALIIAAALVWCAQTLMRTSQAARDDAARARQTHLLQTFAAGVASARTDPAALLAWQPLARTARQLLPDDFAALDRAAGASFPFTKAQIDAAHARWTADWLAWEQSHDAEFKLKAAVAEHDLHESGGSPMMRARLDAVERDKLERYQRRYEEYIRTAKALQALLGE